MSDGQTPVPLSDVAPERARRENDMIDEQMSNLETQVSTLEDEKQDLKDELESVRDEKAAIEDVVEQFKAQRRSEMLSDIKETMSAAAVNEDDFEWEFADLEEADLDTVETVKNAVEATVEAAGLNDGQRVDNRDRSPDLGDVDSGEGTDYEQAADEVADELGMGGAWDKVKSGEDLASPAGMDLGGNQNDSVDELADMLSEAMSE